MINRFTFLILFLSFSLTSIYADNLLEISSDNQLPDFLSNKVIVEGENNSLDNISTDDELLSDPGIKEVNELIEYKAPAYMNVALGYNHSLTNGHGVLADISVNYAPRKWVELLGGISVNTWNIYTASLRGDFRWWVSESRNLAIRNQYLYNVFVDNNFQRFNMSLALAYDQEYFYIAAGGCAQFYTPSFSKSVDTTYIWEPAVISDIRTRIFKKSHVWNLGLQVTNILPFVIERSYIPIFVLNANYRLLGAGENNFNIFAQLACQPAGIFHISANYYSVFFKIGLSCVL